MASTLSELLTFDRFVAWLKTQAPETTCGHLMNKDCVLARYLIASGAENVCVGGYTASAKVGGITAEDNLPERIATAAMDPAGPHTYGAVLDRLGGAS